MVRLSLRDSSGRKIQTGQKLGQGGEGAVYEVAGRPDLAAKVYSSALSHRKAEKIHIMATMRDKPLLNLAAWPLDLLRSDRGAPCGFLMPRVSGHRDVHILYTPKSRKDKFPEAGWRFLVHTAANVARAVAVIHEHGCVIGDINHGSILVSPKATVKIIDCDSFQIEVRGRRFLCEVGVPTYTPPEIQSISFKRVVRTNNHDAFGLAVLIFHLLFLGRHPYAGRFLGVGDMPIERAISEFRFAYSASGKVAHMQPPPHAPTLDTVSQSIALLFERAFSREGIRDGVRPPARQWIHALDDLERRLRVCSVNASHHYLASLTNCPWCRIEAATGAVLFALYIRHGPRPGTFDVGAVWARIVAVEPPGRAPSLPPRSSYIVKPSRKARNVVVARRTRTLSACAIVGLAFATLSIGYVTDAAAFWTLAVSIIVALVVKKSGRDDRPEFSKAFHAAEARWTNLRNRWEQSATDRSFQEELERLKQARRQLEELPRYRREQYRQLEDEKKRHQLRRFLEMHLIDRASISGLGPGRKAMLESFNIETAWDITKGSVMTVPGFGEVLTSNLLAWRRAVEARFRFDPTKGVDPRDIAELDRRIDHIRQKLEGQLLEGSTKLTQCRSRILASRNALWQDLEIAYHSYLRAEADRNAVGA